MAQENNNEEQGVTDFPSIKSTLSYEFIEQVLYKLLPHTKSGLDEAIKSMKEKDLMMAFKLSKNKDTVILYLIREESLQSFQVESKGIAKAIDLQQLQQLAENEQFEKIQQLFEDI